MTQTAPRATPLFDRATNQQRLLDAWRLSFDEPAEGKALAETLARDALLDVDQELHDYAQLALASAYLRYSDYAESERILDALSKQFKARGDARGMAVANAIRATLWYIFGRATEGLALLRSESSETIRSLRPIEQFVYFNALAFNALAVSSSADDGLLEVSIQAHGRALVLARTLEMPWLVVRVTANIAVHQMNAGALDEALRMASEAEDLLIQQEKSNPTLRSVLATVMVMCRMELGLRHDFERDVDALAGFIAISHKGWMMTNIVGPFILAGTLWFLREGDLERARSWYLRCDEELADTPAPDIRLRLAWVRGAWLLASNDAPGAVKVMIAAWESGIDDAHYLSHLSRMIADAQRDLGRLDEAVIWYQRHIEVTARRSRLAARVNFGLLQAREQLGDLERERDLDRLTREHSERTRIELEQFNVALRQKMGEIEALQARLHEQSIRDALTGLYNRRHLNEILPSQISQAQRNRQPMSFVMIDLDHFKAVNDTYGYTMGDSVLAATGGYLAGQLRSSDISCRFGGEEFCIVMPNTSRAGAVLRMQTLLAGYRQLIFSAKDVELSELTFSVGVAELKDTELMTSLLDRADQALYRAKAAGRDRVESA